MKRRLQGIAGGAATGLVGVAGASAQTALQDRFFGGDEGSTDTALLVTAAWRPLPPMAARSASATSTAAATPATPSALATPAAARSASTAAASAIDRPQRLRQRRHRDRGRLRRRLQPRLRQLAHRAERRPRTSPPPLSTARLNHENPPGGDRLASEPAGRFIVRRSGMGQLRSINVPGMLSP